MLTTPDGDVQILSNAERVARAVATVSQGLLEGKWSIRVGCREVRLSPHTYYKHRKLLIKALEEGGAQPIAAVEAPKHTHANQDAMQSQDSTNGEAA